MLAWAMDTILPEKGTPWSELEPELDRLRIRDINDDRALAFVVHCDGEALDVAKRAYRMFFSTNALGGSSVLPSLGRLESDMIRFAAGLLGGGPETVGTLTPGGTESIFLAVKAARDRAAAVRPVPGKPEIVMPASGYPSFDKAAAYLGMTVRRVPMAPGFRADMAAIERAIGPNTVMIGASAPSFSHGIFDPIAEMAALAQRHDLWLHVDGCVGAFLAPFFKELGEPIPEFGFGLPGVTSASADLHKYGYGPKAVSMVLYRDPGLARFADVDFDDWPGGRYGMPALTGTRPGATVAAAWAVMKHLGREGYLRNARRILNARRALMDGIAAIPGLKVLNKPELCILNFGSDEVDPHAVADALKRRGGLVARLARPRGLHIMIVPRHEHAAPGFLAALRESVDEVRAAKSRAAQ